MIIRCPQCGKIKKFGKWIEIPRYLEEDVKKVTVVYRLCNECAKAQKKKE